MASADLSPIDEALKDASLFWHQCREHYHEPERFTANLNALVQALRNVTFRAQSLKSELPGFEAWYEPWQRYIANDPVMKWVNEARRTLVHKQGLQSKSIARVRLVNSYLRPIASELSLPPLLSTAEIADIVSKSIPNGLAHDCILEITRRWVIDDLPGPEVLATLAVAFRILNALRVDLHRWHLEGTLASPQDVLNGTVSAEPMELGAEDATLRIDPVTCEEYEFTETTVPYIKLRQMESLAKARYRLSDSLLPKMESPDDIISLARSLVPLVITVLKKDGYHRPILFIRRHQNRWELHAVQCEDQAAKYAFWHDIAEKAITEGINAVILITEVWMAPAKGIRTTPHQKPSESKRRREAVTIDAADSEGHRLSIVIPFRRALGRVFPGKASEVRPLSEGFLRPVIEVWARNRQNWD
ncbi:MAG: hypothetical protein ACM3X4_01230 [Ignavibacteriales bacterium]